MKRILSFVLILVTNLLFSQIPNQLSNEDKVYGLSKFWQEVNYNFVYLDKIDRTEWNALYKKLITEVQKTENDYEYYRLLQRFCAFLKDGHTNIFLPKEIQDNVYTTYFGEYRIFVTNIDGKAIITRVNASKKNELPIGTEIVNVNGLTTQEHLAKNVRPYIASSTDYIREDRSIQRMLQGYIGTTFNLKLKLPNGTFKTLKVTHAETTEKEVHPPFEERELLDIKWFENDIAYVALNSFSNWEISSQFSEKVPELKKAKKLIVDLRYNGGGNTNIGKEIFKHLTKDEVLYGSKTQSRMHVPTYKAWGKFTSEKDTTNNAWKRKVFLSYIDAYYYDFEYYADSISTDDLRLLKDNRIVVPTVVLIGHGTASAAEDFLIYADKQKHMTKIGEPTFGSTGQPFMFDLVNGGSARICTKKDTYPDGREFVGYGIQPDINVQKTLNDYLENKDPALEKAIEFLKSQK